MRRMLTGLAGLALVLATMGTAAAQGSAVYERRAEFIYQLDVQLGIAPVYPKVPDFTDVPASSPYYGYVEAAFQQGIVSGLAGGLFGPNDPLTRAQSAKILVEAYGAGTAAQGFSSTNFTDNSAIPPALIGYVGEATDLGLMQGVTNTTFDPEGDLTVSQMQDLIRHLATAKLGTTLAVRASATDVAPGTVVTFSTVGKTAAGGVLESPRITYSVRGANASLAVISGNSFVASTSGDYTVQASLGSATASVKVSVYGPAAGLKINPPKTVVANGASQQTLTVDVVDGNGNVVADSTDRVQLYADTNSAAGVLGSSGSLAPSGTSGGAALGAVQGIVSFTLQSGVVPGGTTVLTAVDLTTTTASSATLAVQSVKQQATSLSANALSPYLDANGQTGTGTVDVQVLDQQGEPMLYGTTGFTASLSGPAVFTGSATPASTTGYYANTGHPGAGAPNGLLQLGDVQAGVGPITVTVSAQGLPSATAALTAVITGAATGMQIVPPATTSFSEDSGNAGLTYGIQAIDSHGYPVPFPAAVQASGVTVTVLSSAGGVAQNILVDQSPQSTSGYTDTGAVSNGSFTVTDTQGGADAGSYTMQVTDPSGTLSAAAQTTFSETAGAPNLVVATDPAMACDLLLQTNTTGWCPDQGVAALDSPSRVITAQITDAFGNPVALAGVPIMFDASDGEDSPPVTLTSPQSVSLTEGANGAILTAISNAQGQATATMTAAALAQTWFYLDLWSPDTPADHANYGWPHVDEVGFGVVGTLTTQIQAQIEDQKTTSYSTAAAGDPVQITVLGLDQYGNPATGADVIRLAFSGQGALRYTGSSYPWLNKNADGSYDVWLGSQGTASLDFTATASGSITATVTDLSLPSPLSGSTGFDIQAGAVNAFALIDGSGASAASGESLTANQPAALTLTPEDTTNNATIAGANYIVGLSAASGDGEFRLTPGGASVTQATVPPGSIGLKLFYVNAQTRHVPLSAGAWVSYPNGTSLRLGALQSLTLTGDGIGAGTPSWTFVGTHLGTLTSPTNAATVTYQAPSSAGGSDVIQYTDPAGNTVDITVSY